MHTKAIVYGGVTATVYFLDKGDSIPKHQHPGSHSTSTVAGATEVEIFDGRPVQEVRPSAHLIDLPGGIPHEIRAIEDGTIVVNITHNAVSGDPRPEGRVNGGVLMADGRIEHL